MKSLAAVAAAVLMMLTGLLGGPLAQQAAAAQPAWAAPHLPRVEYSWKGDTGPLTDTWWRHESGSFHIEPHSTVTWAFACSTGVTILYTSNTVNAYGWTVGTTATDSSPYEEGHVRHGSYETNSWRVWHGRTQIWLVDENYSIYDTTPQSCKLSILVTVPS